jgi:hypothetical protein
MFDSRKPGSGCVAATAPSTPGHVETAAAAGPGAARDPVPPGEVPLERLEAQICELAGHLTAATCRFLVLVGDFDARRGWASWEMSSCAAWLSWKCQMSAGTAREHVRVARALRDLPVLRAEFGAGRLSYAKVRALTRIATPATEPGLAEIAGPMTGNQLERFARAHRQVTAASDSTARVRRRLAWRFEDDGSLAGTFRLPPLAGAVLLQALRAAAGDLDPCPDHDGDGDGERGSVSAETPAPGHPAAGTPAAEPAAGGTKTAEDAAAGGPRPRQVTSTSLADALLAIAEAFLAGKIADADNPEIYQVIIHVGTDALAPDAPAPAGSVPAGPAPAGPAPAPGGEADPRQGAGVSAETPAAPRIPGHPADPARCHVQDGPAISISTAQMISCTAALSWLLHDRDGTALDAGRRRRRPTSAQRRAARDRDHCRCRYPGCESRRTDLHHIQYWANGGRTSLDNLISLCPAHHRLIHDRGHLIAGGRGGAFAFYRPDGTLLPPCPALPEPQGTIGDCHDADITPGTIIPPWYGEHLDLDHAIYICFANAANAARHDNDPQPHDQHTPATPPQPAPDTPRWTPRDTEIDVMAAIRRPCQAPALT